MVHSMTWEAESMSWSKASNDLRPEMGVEGTPPASKSGDEPKSHNQQLPGFAYNSIC